MGSSLPSLRVWSAVSTRNEAKLEPAPSSRSLDQLQCRPVEAVVAVLLRSGGAPDSRRRIHPQPRIVEIVVLPNSSLLERLPTAIERLFLGFKESKILDGRILLLSTKSPPYPPMCEHVQLTAPCADCGEPAPTGEVKKVLDCGEETCPWSLYHPLSLYRNGCSIVDSDQGKLLLRASFTNTPINEHRMRFTMKDGDRGLHGDCRASSWWSSINVNKTLAAANNLCDKFFGAGRMCDEIWCSVSSPSLACPHTQWLSDGEVESSGATATATMPIGDRVPPTQSIRHRCLPRFPSPTRIWTPLRAKRTCDPDRRSLWVPKEYTCRRCYGRPQALSKRSSPHRLSTTLSSNNAAAAALAPHVVPAAFGDEPHVGVLGLTERAFKMTFEFETGTNSLDAVAIHDLVYHSEIGNQLRNALFPETSEAIVRHAMSTLEAHVDQMVNPAAALAPLPSPVPTGTAPRCSCPRPHL
ncbi:hypothetical protein HMN09_00305700 [Mycena chlorophos]|uniref:Uncharacterized protein n=1 Tax=Mycena chlorophos TaxID=658473 RepID=A0A8H6WJ97_MYCCL|nr:hypothetical protein HMN09_00305700 [Mycena chlorophos]